MYENIKCIKNYRQYPEKIDKKYNIKEKNLVHSSRRVSIES